MQLSLEWSKIPSGEALSDLVSYWWSHVKHFPSCGDVKPATVEWSMQKAERARCSVFPGTRWDFINFSSILYFGMQTFLYFDPVTFGHFEIQSLWRPSLCRVSSHLSACCLFFQSFLDVRVSPSSGSDGSTAVLKPQAVSEVEGHRFLKFSAKKTPTKPVLELLSGRGKRILLIVRESGTSYSTSTSACRLYLPGHVGALPFPALSRNGGVPSAPDRWCLRNSPRQWSYFGWWRERGCCIEPFLWILRDLVMLLSLAISSLSQRLPLKAVTQPGNKLSKCFRGNEALVYRNPCKDPASASFPRGEQGWSMGSVQAPTYWGWQRHNTCQKHCYPLGGNNGAGCVFQPLICFLSCQSLLVTACASGQSYFFAPEITVKLTFRYSKQLAGI